MFLLSIDFEHVFVWWGVTEFLKLAKTVSKSLSTLLNKFHNSFLVKGQLEALEEAQAENNPTEPDLANDDPEVMESNVDAVDEEAGNTVPDENGGNET